MDPVELQQLIETWARGLFDDDEVLVTSGPPEGTVDNWRGRFVSVGNPEADFEVGQFGSGPDRYNVVWSVPIDVGSAGGHINPGEAHRDAIGVLRPLLNSVAAGDLRLAGTNWTNLSGYETRDEFTTQSRSTVLTLTVLINTIGWNSSDSA